MEFRMFLCLGCPWNLRLEKSSQVTLNPFLHCSPGAKISHAQKNLTVNFHLIEKKKKREKTPTTPCLDCCSSTVNPCLAKQEQEVPVGKPECPSSTAGNGIFHEGSWECLLCSSAQSGFFSLNNKISGVGTARSEAERRVLHPQCARGSWDSVTAVPSALGDRDGVGGVM